MRDLVRLMVWMVVDLLRSRAALETEIWMLRQQINVLRRTAVPVVNQIRRMVETSLEAVALCGASLLSNAFAPVPSPSERGFLNSSPQAEPSVQISCTGLPR